MQRYGMVMVIPWNCLDCHHPHTVLYYLHPISCPIARYYSHNRCSTHSVHCCFESVGNVTIRNFIISCTPNLLSIVKIVFTSLNILEKNIDLISLRNYRFLHFRKWYIPCCKWHIHKRINLNWVFFTLIENTIFKTILCNKSESSVSFQTIF